MGLCSDAIRLTGNIANAARHPGITFPVRVVGGGLARNNYSNNKSCSDLDKE